MARAPRRTFGQPFVVTIAATLPAACFVESRPAPTHPTPVATTTGDPQHTHGTGPGPVVTNPPRPVGPDPSAPPPPAPAREATWTVFKSGATCQASIDPVCAPNAICNPPPPNAYACPPGMPATGTVKVRRETSGDCFLQHPPPTCPPNAMCNPPPPQKVSCPK